MTAVSVAVFMGGLGFFVSGMTFLLVLILLGRKDFQYATKQDLEEVLARMLVVAKNQSRLWRAMEALDDRCDAAGLPVLRKAVPSQPTQASRRHR